MSGILRPIDTYKTELEVTHLTSQLRNRLLGDISVRQMLEERQLEDVLDDFGGHRDRAQQAVQKLQRLHQAKQLGVLVVEPSPQEPVGLVVVNPSVRWQRQRSSLPSVLPAALSQLITKRQAVAGPKVQAWTAEARPPRGRIADSSLHLVLREVLEPRTGYADKLFGEHFLVGSLSGENSLRSTIMPWCVEPTESSPRWVSLVLEQLGLQPVQTGFIWDSEHPHQRPLYGTVFVRQAEGA